MQDILIKNGKVLLFENNDVVIKEMDVKISNEKITKIEKTYSKNQMTM